MGRYLMRLKYDKLKENRTDHDQENEKNDVVSLFGEMNLKLIKFREVSNLQLKIMSSIVLMQRVRDAYVEVMHRFAEHFIQLNNGTTHAYSFKKVTCSP